MTGVLFVNGVSSTLFRLSTRKLNVVTCSSTKLTLFEMNCWFPCGQGHVINRQPAMQISLPE